MSRKFTLQLQFLTVVLGTIATVLAALSTSKGSIFHLIVNSVCFLISIVFFFGMSFDIFKESEILDKTIWIFHMGGGMLIILGAIIAMSVDRNSRAESEILWSGAIAIVNGLLYLMIGYQLHGIATPGTKFKPFYLTCNCNFSIGVRPDPEEARVNENTLAPLNQEKEIAEKHSD